MTLTDEGEPDRERLRLWPGVVAVVLQWLLWFALPIVMPEAAAIGFIAGVLGGLVVLVWWMFFSRVPRLERWGALPLIVLAMAAIRRFVLDPSIATGMMGMMYVFSAIPVVSLALVAWAAISRRMAEGPRRATLAAAIVAACAVFALLRTDGVTGEGRSQLAWRWSKSSEQRLLARAVEPPAPPTVARKEAPTEAPPKDVPKEATPKEQREPAAIPPPRAEVPPKRAAWPGFRDLIATASLRRTDQDRLDFFAAGRVVAEAGRTGLVVLCGRRRAALHAGAARRLEVVACYNAANGEPVWTHSDAARFWESNAGAGPRGTPASMAGAYIRWARRES